MDFKKLLMVTFLCLVFVNTVQSEQVKQLKQPKKLDQIVTLVSDPWPPYVNGELGGDAKEGLAIKIINEIFSRLDGVSVRLSLIPWQRALEDAEKGLVDGIPILLKTPEREEYLAYTDSLVTSYELAWYSKERFPEGLEWETMDDLMPYTIGVVSGYTYAGPVNKAIAENVFTTATVNNEKQLFDMLAGGRIDIAFSTQAVGSLLAKQQPKDHQITSMKKPTGEETFYMAFSKKSKVRELIPKINQILFELKQEGFIARVLAGN